MNNKIASWLTFSILLGSFETAIAEKRLNNYEKFDYSISNNIKNKKNLEKQKESNFKNSNLNLDIFNTNNRFYTPKYIDLFFSNLIANLEN